MLFNFSVLFSNNTEKDVNHMVVDKVGNTIECYIDSFGYEYVYFIPKDSVDRDSINLNKIYYAYNDFNRIFHYSWSFRENLKRIQNTTGQIFTINGDTINYIDIQFNHDMINPEIFVKTGMKKSEYIDLLKIKRIETDFSILSHAVKRGFYYSYYPFIILTTLDIFLKWDSQRRFVPQIWDNYNDLLPGVATIGMKDTGVAYQALTSILPSSVLLSMGYDYIKKKNIFYFTPVYEKTKFGRNMHIFSFKQMFKNRLDRIFFTLNKTSIGNKVLSRFR